jgi:hypothetical protein
MARYFAITVVTSLVELDAERTGKAAFTVKNATAGRIRGDAVALPQPGSERATYAVDDPSRLYAPGVTESVTVTVTAPAQMEAGTYSFQLRMLLGGGVPEEQYDDSQVVTYVVPDAPIIEGDAKIPAKKPFPWWIVAVIAGLIVLVVIGVVAFVALREPDPIVNAQVVTIPPFATADMDTGTLSSTGADVLFQTDISFGTFAFMTPLRGATVADVGDAVPGRSGCQAAATTANAIFLLGMPPGRFFCMRTDAGHTSQLRLLQPVAPFGGTLQLEVTTWP